MAVYPLGLQSGVKEEMVETEFSSGLSALSVVQLAEDADTGLTHRRLNQQPLRAL